MRRFLSGNPSPIGRKAKRGLALAGGLLGVILAFWLIYQIPAVNDRLFWRAEILKGKVLRVLYPGDTVPVAHAGPVEGLASPVALPPSSDLQSEETALRPAATPLPLPTSPRADATPAPTPTPAFNIIEPPLALTLPAPKWEKQGWNNCGPATLAMGLRYWGWPGNQEDVANVLKPSRVDKNVRWDELVYYVKTQAGWLDATFRVGGTPDIVKKFIADGYPVIVEKGLVIEENNTGWTGHYNLITGYDDKTQTWIAQDSWKGANQVVSYADMNKDWQSFNYLYILIYPADDKEKIAYLLGDDADEAADRERALAIAQSETQADPNNAFAWMNLGSNLTYFKRYTEAAAAFDKARALGLPYRTLWYQFSPYRAYYNVGRYRDVIDLADATLKKADNLEESYFWRGWARFSLGDRDAAIGDFRAALKYNPDYLDAQTALTSLGVAP